MAFHYKTQGIILKKRDAGEANRVFTVFSKEYGKVALWAASERKITSKLRGGLTLFSLSNLSFIQGKQKKVLVEAVPARSFLPVPCDLSCLRAAYLAAHLLDLHTAKEEQDERVWELLHNFFVVLGQESSPQQAYQSFAPQFLGLAGYGKEPILS